MVTSVGHIQNKVKQKKALIQNQTIIENKSNSRSNSKNELAQSQIDL